MSANVDAMVDAAIRAYRAGNKEEARTLLFRVVDIDERHEQAWLWLSAVIDSPDDQRTCLENVLAINPYNDRAKQGLEVLNRKSGKSKPPEDDLAGLTFGDQGVSSSSSIGEELPDIDWSDTGIETSSASASFSGKEPSPAEYDEWVSGLNLGSNNASSVFGDEGIFEEDVFGFDDPPPASTPSKSAASTTPAAPAFVGPFEADLDLDDFDLELSDDDFIPPPQKPAAPSLKSPEPRASKSVMSPGTSPVSTRTSPKTVEDDDLSDLDLDYDEIELNYQDQDPEEFFHYIPSDIKPTRLPGTREGAPVLLMVGLIMLVVLNIGAVGLLITQLAAG